jgi:hypothetical protein
MVKSLSKHFYYCIQCEHQRGKYPLKAYWALIGSVNSLTAKRPRCHGRFGAKLCGFKLLFKALGQIKWLPAGLLVNSAPAQNRRQFMRGIVGLLQ